MRREDLRRALQSLADDAPSRRPDAGAVMRRAVRRLWSRGALAGVVALAVGTSALIAVDRAQRPHQSVSITSPSEPSRRTSSTTTTPNPRALSAATIADGRWSGITPFPLAARRDESVVWTGTQMIVWGGDNGSRVFGNGAAYDPTTNSWRILPPAPIAARTMAAAAWTGREMLVWGGDRAYVGDYASDGAAFDPAIWKWRRIATGPLTPRYGAHMLWTGREAILIGGSDSNTGSVFSALDAAAYSPATDHWHRIASLPPVAGAGVEDVRLVWTGRAVLAWELATRTTATLTTFRLRLVEYNPSTNTWQAGPPPDDPHRNVVSPIWTGGEVIAPAAPPLCDLPDGAQNCGPPPTNLRAAEFDPTTGTWRSIAHGPADDAESASVWTGDDLVVLSGGLVDSSTGKTVVQPGTAAAWSPSQDAWTTLPRAPFVPSVDLAVWTGSEVLAWGSTTTQPGGVLADRGLRYGPTRTTTTHATTTTTGGRTLASPTPTDACTAAHLRLALARDLGSVAMQPAAFFSLTNRGSEPCLLDGYPALDLFDATGHRIGATAAHAGSYEILDPGPHAVTVDPGGRVYFGIGWSMLNEPDGNTTGCVQAATATVVVPDARSALTARASLERQVCPGGVSVTAIGSPTAFVAWVNILA